MKHFVIFTLFLFSVARCYNDLVFEEQSFNKKTTLPCKENCPEITVKIPVAKDVPVVADSINKGPIVKGVKKPDKDLP